MANSSVTVSGISDADLAALQSAGMDDGSANPSIDDMRYATQVAPAYTPAATPSFMESLPTLDEASNYLVNLPAQAQRLLTNPAAFTEMLTGKNPLPEQAGFAASATGLPAQNPNSLFTPAGMAYNNGYESGEPVSIAAMGVPALAPAGRFLGSAAADRIMAGKALIPGTNTEYLNPQIMSAVKEKGGNWAQNSLDQLNDLKHTLPVEGHMNRGDWKTPYKTPEEYLTAMNEIGYTPRQIDEIKHSVAVNNWIESKLKKYVRNEMGTPQDPVRELADQGITHIQDLGEGVLPQYNDKDFIGNKRLIGGMPKEGFANTPAGKDWEARSDVAIDQMKAGLIQPKSSALYSPDIGELAAKNPEAVVHALDSQTYRLGFDHLVDELANTVHPNSDLPAHLRLKPETLDKMTVPHAVKHVAKINKYRAEQMANAAKEDLKQFPIVHEGGNGYNIHELKLPEHNKPYEELSEKRKELHDDMIKDELKFSPEYALKEANKREAYDKLDRALKNEGEQMGNCVGTYCDRIVNGSSRVFSLRDPKGGSHATIEMQPMHTSWDHIPRSVKDEANRLGDAEARAAGYTPDSMFFSNYSEPARVKYLEDWIKNNPKISVTQIRGKANGTVNEKYRTYIKDWLNKEADKIGHAQELGNVGLVDTKNTHSMLTELKDMYGNDGIHLYNAAVEANPTGGARFMSRDDLRKFIESKPPVKEQKMLQGFYRGYAGEGAHPEGTTFVSPQKSVADYYAQKRAGQTGLTPHAEMVLADPFAGAKYGHATAGTGSTPNIVTQARKLEPNQIQSRTQLYAEGGKVEKQELTPSQMREALFADSRKYQAEKAASEPRTLEQRMIDQGRLSPKGGGSGGAGFTPGIMNPFNPDSPLNHKNGGKIPSIDEMRLTILRNK